MWRSARLRLPLALAFLIIVSHLAGCGRPVGTLTGKVTYQGKPLKAGNVVFFTSDGGRSFSAGLTEEGVYKVPDLQGGAYKVCVETKSVKPVEQIGSGGMIPKGAKAAPPPGANVPEGYATADLAAAAQARAVKLYTFIPDHYGDPEQSGLTYEFKGGDETFNIDLK